MPHSQKIESLKPSSQGPQSALVQAVLHALQDLRFGSVELTIHDSKVVQIERREKIRFDRD